MYLEKKSTNESNDVNNRNLLDLNVILLRKVDNNKNLKSSSNANESKKNVHEIDDDEALRHVNESRVIKTKNRSIEAKNKKDTMSRTNKTKTRSIKRDSFDFEHVETNIKILRDSDRHRERDRGESTFTLDRALRQKSTIAIEEINDTRNIHTKYIK